MRCKIEIKIVFIQGPGQMLKLKKPSLIFEFKILAFIVAISAISLFVLISVQSYSFYSERIIHKLEAQGGYIERSFTNAIDHTAYMMDILISQIRQNSRDVHYIEGIMSKFKINPKVENILTWTAFSWANPSHKIVVDVMYGILKEPIDLSHRDYISRTVKEPGRMHLGKPVFGSTSKTWMIPAGIGALDQHNNYIGTMTIGFNISALIDKFKDAINMEGIDFVLIDKSLKVVLKSSDNIDNFRSQELSRDSKLYNIVSKINLSSSQDNSASFIKIFGNYDNYYIFKFKHYPYILYLTYDKTLIKDEIWKIFFFRSLELAAMGVIFLMLLILLYYQIVLPLVKLSEAANKISNGETVQKIPRGRTYEIASIALQLLKVKRSMFRERRANEKLAQAIHIAKESDKAREEFAQRIRSETKEALRTISTLTELLIESLTGKLDFSLNSTQFIKFLQTILQATLQISETTSNILNPSYISITDIINESIIIQSKFAHIRKVNFITKFEENIPLLFADEVRIKQIIVGLLARSLEFSSEGNYVQISVCTKSERKMLWLIIKILDNCFGLSNIDRERIQLHYDNDQFNNKDGICLDMGTIERLVELHNGNIKFSDIYGEGSTVTIALPYLKEENEPSVELDNIIPLFKVPNKA